MAWLTSHIISPSPIPYPPPPLISTRPSLSLFFSWLTQKFFLEGSGGGCTAPFTPLSLSLSPSIHPFSPSLSDGLLFGRLMQHPGPVTPNYPDVGLGLYPSNPFFLAFLSFSISPSVPLTVT